MPEAEKHWITPIVHIDSIYINKLKKPCNLAQVRSPTETEKLKAARHKCPALGSDDVHLKDR